MSKVLAIIIITGLCTGCAAKSSGKFLNAGVVAAGAADLATTRYAIDHLGGVEVNPVLGQEAWRQAVLKAAAMALIIEGSRRLEREHPALANWVRATAIVGWGAAAGYNMTVIWRMQ